MTIVCDISAKDLLSKLNIFSRSNWMPSKNSINIYFSSYSIQAAGIGLWGFAKEIAGDLIHYWNQNWLLSNTLHTLWKKNNFLMHIKSNKLFPPQYFTATFCKLKKSVKEQIELWWISFSPSFYEIVCKISAKNSLSPLKFLAGGNSMLAKIQ